jgi:hypothetical protein
MTMIDADGTPWSDEEERAYQEHINREGDGAVNEHPEGCFFCGSTAHHSNDCQDR